MTTILRRPSPLPATNNTPPSSPVRRPNSAPTGTTNTHAHKGSPFTPHKADNDSTNTESIKTSTSPKKAVRFAQYTTDDHPSMTRSPSTPSNDDRSRSDEEPDGCLFVASLVSTRSPQEIENILSNFFSRWGDVVAVRSLRDWLQRPFAFVQFKDPKDAQKALVEAHKTICDGREIRVEAARVNRTVFYTFARFNGSQNALHQQLLPFGPIEQLRIVANPTHIPAQAGAVVKFRYRSDALRCYLATKSSDPLVFCEWADAMSRFKPGSPVVDPSSVFVGNLPHSVTEDDLAQHFAKHGLIKKLQLIRRISTIPNHALITFPDEVTAAKVVKQENNAVIHGNVVRVALKEMGRTPEVPPERRSSINNRHRKTGSDTSMMFHLQQGEHTTPPQTPELRRNGNGEPSPPPSPFNLARKNSNRSNSNRPNLPRSFSYQGPSSPIDIPLAPPHAYITPNSSPVYGMPGQAHPGYWPVQQAMWNGWPAYPDGSPMPVPGPVPGVFFLPPPPPPAFYGQSFPVVTTAPEATNDTEQHYQ